MVTASLISRLSQAVDQLEERLQQNRPLKIVKVRRGLTTRIRMWRELATSRPIPRIEDANITVFEFYDDEEVPAESQDRSRRAQTAEFKDRDP